MKKQIFIVALASVLAVSVTANDARAQSTCGSWSKVTKDIWDRWGSKMKALGCKNQEECLAKKDKTEALVRDIVAFINAESQGSWATLGPRPFAFGAKLDGKIVAAGERLFVSQGPVVDRAGFNLTVVKQGGKNAGKVTVSVVNPDNTCSQLPGGEVTFTDDDREQRKTIRVTNVQGKEVVIKVDAQGSVTKSFDYYLVAE